MELINDILDFSKIESGRLNMESISFDLIKIVEETSNLMAIRANKKQIELICKVDPNIQSSVKGDPGKIRQILNNLIGNAVNSQTEAKL